MKKICFLFLCLILFLPIFKAEEIVNDAKSYILIEPITGKVLVEKNVHERLSPASMTKIMSMLLILEKIEDNKLKWDDIVVTSSNAASMGGSQIFLEPNEKMNVKDLFKAVAVASANDATVALAEKTYGTESNFVKKMNEKVKKLGLKNTNFKNATGLDAANHYSTSYDMAYIARELIKYEKIFEFSTIYEDYLRENSENKFWLVNTNKLIRTYQGADGLKTGYTKEAGYCLTATAKQNNMRLIGTIMGSSSSNSRNDNMAKLLDYGFNMFKVQQEIKKGDIVLKKEINKADKQILDIVAKEDAVILLDKDEENKKLNYELKLNNIKLPLKKNTVVGKLYLKEQNKIVSTIELTVKEDIKKANIFTLYKRTLLKIISGNM